MDLRMVGGLFRNLEVITLDLHLHFVISFWMCWLNFRLVSNVMPKYSY